MAGVGAQAAGESPGARADWITLGVGLGDLTGDGGDHVLFDAMSFTVSGNLLRSHHIWQARFTRVVADDTGGDLALLCERVLSRRRILVSAGVGPGLVYRTEAGHFEPLCCALKSAGGDGDVFPAAGVAWSAQALFGEGSGTGLGCQVFGTAAGERSFWGLALVLRMGEQPRAAADIHGP